MLTNVPMDSNKYILCCMLVDWIVKIIRFIEFEMKITENKTESRSMTAIYL